MLVIRNMWKRNQESKTQLYRFYHFFFYLCEQVFKKQLEIIARNMALTLGCVCIHMCYKPCDRPQSKVLLPIPRPLGMLQCKLISNNRCQTRCSRCWQGSIVWPHLQSMYILHTQMPSNSCSHVNCRDGFAPF